LIVQGEEGGIRTTQRTINGKEYTFSSDELIIPDDEKGDTKIDIHGVLQGGELSLSLPRVLFFPSSS